MSARFLSSCLFLLSLVAMHSCFGELQVVQRPTHEGIPVVWGDAFGSDVFNVPPDAPKLVALAIPRYAIGLTRYGAVYQWGTFTSSDPKAMWGRFSELSNIVKVVANREEAIFLNSGGQVFMRGPGITNIPLTLTKAVDIAILQRSSVALALKPDGALQMWWGESPNYGVSLPQSATNVVAIAGGYQNFGAIRADGSVVVWGASPTLNQVPLQAMPAKALAIGFDTAHTLKMDGSVFSWGNDKIVAPTGLRAVSITVGTGYENGQVDWAMAVKEDGSIAGWGTNVNGRLTFAARQTNVISVHGPAYAGALIDAEPLPLLPSLNIAFPERPSSPPNRIGSVVVWGMNDAGQLNIPSRASNVVAVSAGLSHTIALRRDSTVVGWGLNTYGQTSIPTGLSNVVSISAGFDHNLALKRDSSMVAWGLSEQDLTIVPNREWHTNIAAVAAGSLHNEILLWYLGRPTVEGWGPDSIPSFPGFFFPQKTNHVAVVAGYHWTCALYPDGTIGAIGRDDEGQCSVPNGLNGVVAIARGYQHAMALRSDGTVVCWGRNSEGQCNVPAGLTNVVGIAGGSYHSVALRKDGTVVAWGGNSFNQLAVPATLSRVFAITAGTKHTVALVDPTPEIEVVAGNSGTVTLAMRGLIGQAYQLESSTTLGDWVNEGDSFMADRATVNRNVDVASPAKFYRLREAQ